MRSFREDPGFMRCVTAWERIPARPARTAPWLVEVDPRLIAAVRDQTGYIRIYLSHEGAARRGVRIKNLPGCISMTD